MDGTYAARSRRVNGSGAFALEREASVPGRVRDLELIRWRLRGREVPLELEARTGESASERMVRVARTPGEDLEGAADRPCRARNSRKTSRPGRRLRSDDIGGEGCRDHRRDQLRPAARVLLRCGRATVLVRTDRDVLGAVIGGELRPRQGGRGGGESGPPPGRAA